MRKRRRQGRKRKALPRIPSGRLSRSLERRTLERAQSELETRQSLSAQQEGRARGLGLTVEQSSHPLSESIAGRMALRGILTFSQAEAIDEYAKLVRRTAIAMRSPAGTRCSLNLKRGGEVEENPETYARIMQLYNEAFRIVRNVGERACRAINLIVRDLCDLPASEWEFARSAAVALARHFGFDERRTA